jgi:hypothetical protein
MSARQRRLAYGFLALALLLIALVGVMPAGAAQNYSFSVETLSMQVYVQPDASARIVYDITFVNSQFGSPIDIVDIGTPHEDYRISAMTATVDGVEVTDIRPSEFVDPGVEIHLGRAAIAAGETGTLHFEFVMPDLVYQDTTDRDYASLQITPTWFDRQFVRGTSNVQIAIHLLREVHPNDIRFQDVPYNDLVLFDGRPAAVWQMPTGSATGPNLVGVSFPKTGMSRVVEQTLLELAVKWLEDYPQVRFIGGAFAVALFAFAFLRFSGGTGFSLLVVLGGGLILLLVVFPAFLFLAFPGVLAIVGLNEYYLRRRRLKYLPAIAQVEGGGIKRGLTAPEAAVLLELPLNKILTLIMFGLLEKGIVQTTQEDPLAVEVAPDYRSAPGAKLDDKRGHRLAVAQARGAVIRTYEHPFLDVIEGEAGRPVHELELGQAMKQLIAQTAERIGGFDLSDTQDYYRQIIARAIAQAKSIGNVPEREQYVDKHLQWLLLDDRYRNVIIAPDFSYRPVWVRGLPGGGGARVGPPGGGGRSEGPAVGGRTSVGDVAASFAGWTENTMGRLASAITPGSVQVSAPDGGFINLSGADRVTGDIFKAMAEASRSSGGGRSGGGCACACAGCACACACAGGGR